MAELWGIYHGLHLSWSKGYREVALETDSLTALMQLKRSEGSIAPRNRLLDAIRELLTRPCKCSIKHIYREANMCADWMSTHYDDLSLGLHIFDSPPPGLSSLLTADAMELV